MPRSTTISIRSAISSPASSTNKGAPPRWPSGAPSRPNRRLGLRLLRPTQTTCRCSDKASFAAVKHQPIAHRGERPTGAWEKLREQDLRANVSLLSVGAFAPLNRLGPGEAEISLSRPYPPSDPTSRKAGRRLRLVTKSKLGQFSHGSAVTPLMSVNKQVGERRGGNPGMRDHEHKACCNSRFIPRRFVAGSG